MSRVVNFIGSERLSGMEEFLRTKVIGQDQCLGPISRAVIRAEMGMLEEEGTMGNYLMLGPTGVGKTQTALALAEFLGKPFHRFDMSEFMSASSVDRFIGRNRDEQGVFGDVIDSMPDGGILLYDEIEKAHEELMNLFLAGFGEAARITMANGAVKSLSNFYNIATSNLGGREVIRMRTLPYETVVRRSLLAAQEFFKPELLGRFPEKLVYNRLSDQVQFQIAEMQVAARVSEIEKQVGLKLLYGVEVLNALVKIGFHKELGARPMKQAVNRHVGDVAAAYLMKGGNPYTTRLLCYDDRRGFFIDESDP